MLITHVMDTRLNGCPFANWVTPYTILPYSLIQCAIALLAGARVKAAITIRPSPFEKR